MKRKILSHLLVALVLLSLSLGLAIWPVAAENPIQEAQPPVGAEELTDSQEGEKKDDKSNEPAGTPAEALSEGSEEKSEPETEEKTQTTSEEEKEAHKESSEEEPVEPPSDKSLSKPADTPEGDQTDSATNQRDNMKKALEEELNKKSEEDFVIQPFSIIQPTQYTHTYIFKVDGEEKAQQIVKNGEKLLEPEIPEKDHARFVAWQVENADPEELIDFSQAIVVTETKTITLVPKFEEVYYVYFMWPTGGELDVIASREGQSGESIDTTDVLFSDIVSPKLEDQAFDGWYTNEKLTGDPVGDSITITNEDITLWPKFRTTGYWLHFFPGDDASAVESIFVQNGTTPTLPAAPTRVGYTFKHWSTEENGNEFDASSELTKDTTLYAVWAPAEVNYTVVFWLQCASDNKNATDAEKTYDFGKKEIRSAQTGDIVGPSTDDQQWDYPNFHYNATNSVKVTVEPDGSTALNIYYDRNLFYIHLHFLDGSEEVITGLYGTALQRDTEEYNIAYNRDENIAPSYRHFMWTGDKDSTSSEVRGYPLPFHFDSPMFRYGNVETTEHENDTAHLYQKSGYPSAIVNFIDFQQLDGSYPDASDGFADERSMGVYGYYYPILDVYPGFTFEYYSKIHPPTDADWESFEGQEIIDTTDLNSNIFHIRAKRNSYNLIFWNYDKEVKTETVLYNALLKDHEDFIPQRPQHLPEYYDKFEGWYLDDQFKEGPCDFDTQRMPASDMILFAKWGDGRSVEALAYLTKEGGKFKSLTKEYGAVIKQDDLPQVEREDGTVVKEGDADQKVIIPNHAQWIGWTTKDADGNYQLYSFGQAVYTRTELYPYYVDKNLFTVTYHYPGASGEITKVDPKAYAKDSRADLWPWPDDGVVPEGKVFLAWTTDKDKSDASRGPAASATDSTQGSQTSGIQLFAASMAAAAEPKTTYTPKEAIIMVANVKLYPLFGPKEEKVQITYDGNGGKQSGTDGKERVVLEPKVLNNSKLTVLDNTDPSLGFERQVELSSGTKDCKFRLWEYVKKGESTKTRIKPGVDFLLDLEEPEKNVLYAVWATPIEIKVKSVWNDNDDEAKKRPDQVSFKLLLNGTILDDPLTLDESAKWQGLFGQKGDLWDIDEDGNPNNYQLQVPDVEGYSKKLEGDFKTGFTVTYSCPPEPIPTPTPSGPVILLQPLVLEDEPLPTATMPAPSVPEPDQVLRLPRTGESRLINYGLSASLVLAAALLACLRKKYKG